VADVLKVDIGVLGVEDEPPGNAAFFEQFQALERVSVAWPPGWGVAAGAGGFGVGDGVFPPVAHDAGAEERYVLRGRQADVVPAGAVLERAFDRALDILERAVVSCAAHPTRDVGGAIEAADR
jgi:hypothetical protein